MAAQIAGNMPGFRGFSRRFVAGTTQGDVIDTVRRLNAQGFEATVSFLGEAVTTRAEVDAAVREFTTYADAVLAHGLGSHLSIKLTELGLAFDRDLAAKSLQVVLARAGGQPRDDSVLHADEPQPGAAVPGDRTETGETQPNSAPTVRGAAAAPRVFVRVDMEESRYTEATLEMVREARRRHTHVGVVVQAYLRRSAADVEALSREGVPVRLVKGAYREPEDVAFQSKEEVDASFTRLADRYFASMGNGAWLAIATHDARMVRAAMASAKAHGVARGRYEFQMLYGIRGDLQRWLLAEGYRVRVYVPYGSHWYPYLMRRLAERPANLWFFLRNAVRRG